jgi:acyl-CoA reductase-like NAD-dependent aldehyde dehydrogenase
MHKEETAMVLQSINPATAEELATFDEYSPEQINRILDEVHTAFTRHDTTFAQRSELMHRAAAYLRNHRAELARLITLEMGKPNIEAEAEIDKCAWNCDFYADNAQRFLSDEHIATNARESYVAFEPLGVILAIMPWNFPFWQVFRFAAPAIMAGNTAILKHASNVPQCALAIERVFQETGFPPGTFRTLLISGPTAEKLIADDRIRAVTLTGSAATGMSIAAAAGRALKKTVLELGGSDPFIVLEDADLDGAARTAARARFQNTGQSCIAAKRFIVVDAVADAFLERFKAATAQLKIGDPFDHQTQIGPLARDDLRHTLHRQIQESLRQGAHLEMGGEPIKGRGYFYAPTIVSNVTPAMPMFREETFGPAAAVIRVKHADEAIALANASEYGLGSNLWTQDIDRARALARRIEAGNVFINGMTASDPRLPFGGVKHSGYGRELSSFGIREFVNIQTIWIGPAQGPQQGTRVAIE